MEAEAAKYIGAGIACLGMGGAGIGLGMIFGNYLSGALRNPSAADGQFGRLLFGFAVTEALGIFSLLVALILSSSSVAISSFKRVITFATASSRSPCRAFDLVVK